MKFTSHMLTRLTHAVPELIKSGQFPFFDRRYGNPPPSWTGKGRTIRKNPPKGHVQPETLSDQEYMAKYVAPFILRD